MCVCVSVCVVASPVRSVCVCVCVRFVATAIKMNQIACNQHNFLYAMQTARSIIPIKIGKAGPLKFKQELLDISIAESCCLSRNR